MYRVRGDAAVRVVNLGQTPATIRKSKVLMVQSVEGLPAELEVPAFGDVKLFGQSRIHVPKAWRAKISESGTHSGHLPVSRVSNRRGARVHSERRLEGGRVDPLIDLVGAAAVSVEARVADQVAPGGSKSAAEVPVGQLIARAEDGLGQPGFRVEIGGQPPNSYQAGH